MPRPKQVRRITTPALPHPDPPVDVAEPEGAQALRAEPRKTGLYAKLSRAAYKSEPVEGFKIDPRYSDRNHT
eukprot:50333-Eustigmatos_ZCMA.PRE.1